MKTHRSMKSEIRFREDTGRGTLCAIPDLVPKNMVSEYHIVSPLHGKSLLLEEEQFKDLKRARKRLSAVHAIHHKFYLVEANLRLITEALLALMDKYISGANKEELLQASHRVNACVNNYVLSARTYTAQLKRHIQSCLPHDRLKVHEVTAQMETEYKRSFSYRFMECLYDYVSYNGLSVHAVHIVSEITDETEISRTFCLSAFIDRDYLGGPGDFRASVLKETPARIDLIVLLEKYMESLNTIHNLALGIVKPVAQSSESIVQDYIYVFTAKHGIQQNLFVVHTTGQGEEDIYDQFPITMYVDKVPRFQSVFKGMDTLKTTISAPDVARYMPGYCSSEHLSFNYYSMSQWLSVEQLRDCALPVTVVRFPWRVYVANFDNIAEFVDACYKGISLVTTITKYSGLPHNSPVYLEVDHKACTFAITSSDTQALHKFLESMTCPEAFSVPDIALIDESAHSYVTSRIAT